MEGGGLTPFCASLIKVKCWSLRLIFADFLGIHSVVRFWWFWRAFEKKAGYIIRFEKKNSAQTSSSKITLLKVTNRQYYKMSKLKNVEISKFLNYEISKLQNAKITLFRNYKISKCRNYKMSKLQNVESYKTSRASKCQILTLVRI